MSQQPMSLAHLQREMAAAVMTPLTADEQMSRHAADGRSMDKIAESFIAPNSRLKSFERLEIYNRQYWFRVLGALADDFPALRSVMGARSFEAMSVAYLTSHPSRSFSLRNLGSKLPEWLRLNPLWSGRRHCLAIDVARIEWAFIEAFDSGERDPLTLEQIATLDADSRLALQPHVQLVALDYPVDDLVLALHHTEKRQTSEAGVKHHDESTAPAKLPPLRPSTICVSGTKSFKPWPQFVAECRLEKPSKRASPPRASRVLAVRSWSASGLPHGPNSVGSARPTSNPSAHDPAFSVINVPFPKTKSVTSIPPCVS